MNPLHAANATMEGFAVVSAAVTGVLMIRRRRTAPSVAPSLVLVMLGIVAWGLTGLVTRFGATLSARVVGAYLFLGALALLVLGYYLTARALVDSSYRPSRAGLALLLVNPAAVVVCLAVEPLHTLLIGDFGPGEHGFWWRPGPLFWVHAGYSYLVFVAAAAIELSGLRHAARSHQAQLVANLASALVPLTGCILLTLHMRANGGAITDDTPDLAALGFTVTALVNLWSLLNQGLLTVLPVARGLVFQQLSEAVFIFDTAGYLVDHNTEAATLVADCGGVIGAGARLPDILAVLGPDVAPRSGEYVVRATPAREIDLRLSEVSTRGRRYATSIVIRDVTGVNRSRREALAAEAALRRQLDENEALRRELLDQSRRDPLTGIHNRRRLEEVLAEQASSRIFSLAIVDIDHFKSVNDRHGHLVGDDVLVAVARALDGATVGAEQVFRYGGEEFVVIMPGVAGSGALARGWELADAARDTRLPDVPGLRLTASIGVASLPEDGLDPITVLRAADTALYRAKALGRDRVEGARPTRLVATATDPAGSCAGRTA